jgi:tetratricopeptide (TPR) repeat protein
MTKVSESKVEELVALLGLYLKQGKIGRALKLLERTRQEFVQVGADDYWHLWRGQLLVGQGQPVDALGEVEHIKDAEMSRNFKTLALEVLARQSNDWHPLETHLEESFQKTQDGGYLLELCRLKAHSENWNFVADHADELINRVDTADAVRLSASAAWKAERYEQCLRILNDHQRLFPNGMLPADLWRLRVLCHVSQGTHSQAVADAEELIRQDPSTANIITLMDVQISKGDLKGAAITARALARRDDVEPLSLVRTAGLIHTEDADLAKELWRRAKDASVNDPILLGGALSVGFALGLDEEMGPLLQRMQEVATEGNGPFQVFDMKQLLSMTKERGKHLEEVNKLYNEAKIPIHLVSWVTKSPLADYLHGIPEWNRAGFNPLRQLRVFTRFGGRPVQKELSQSSKEWRLHLDVSALLLTADIGVLDKIEECFKPLRISSALPKALLEQYERLQTNQPSRVADYNKVLESYNRNIFQLIPDEANPPTHLAEWEEKMGGKWLAIMGRAEAEGGFLVDFLPLRTNDSEFTQITLPSHLEEHIINCRAVIDGLKAHGRIPEQRYRKSLEKLGTEGNNLGRAVPPLGASLFLTGTIASVLADAGLLETACKNFKVYVDPLVVDVARNEIAEVERRIQLTSWLRRLMERLRAGLESGTYEFIGIPDERRRRANEELAKEESTPDDNLTLTALLDLFLYNPSPGDVLWIDDRFTSTYLHRAGAPIIGVNEVLAALLLLGNLSEDEYYGTLLKLRTGNVRYIPIQRKEILYHLRYAELADGVLIETPELSILRRYVAACLLDGECLQRPTTPVGPDGWIGELMFVLNIQRAVGEAIAGVWAETEIPASDAAARADWLLHNLYTGGFGTRELLPDPDSRGDGLDLIGIDIGGAYMKAFNIGEARRAGDDLNCRQQYFQWLDSRLTSRRFKADQGAVVAAAKSVSSLISGAAAQRYDEPIQDLTSRIVLQKVFLDLPETLKNELKLDPEVMARVGIRLLTTAMAGPLNFQAEEFWSAAEKAINEEPVSVEAHNPEATYTFTRDSVDEGQVIIKMEDSSGAVAQRIKDPLFDLLNKDHARREVVLRNNRAWFDCDVETFEKEVREIASTDDVLTRMERIDKWRKESAALFYKDLAAKIVASEPIQRSNLIPPSADGLLRHFRFNLVSGDAVNFTDLLSRSAALLTEEEGLESALERLVTLPVKLPSHIVKRLSKLEESERRAVLENLSSRCRSPVSRLHLADLALSSAATDGWAIEMARSLLAELFNDDSGDTSFNLLDAFLTVVNEEFGYWADVSQWPSEIKLALVWSHASRLQNIFHALPNRPDDLLAWLGSPDRLMSTEILLRDADYWYDVLHPRKLNRVEFLSHGVAAVFLNHDTRVLEELNLKEFIRRVAFIDSEETPDVKMPDVHLIKDPMLATNRTGSFLGGDRAAVLSPIIGEEGTDLLASANLEQLVRETVEDLHRDPTQLHRWLTIYGVVGGNPIYQGVRERYQELLRGLDLISLHDADPRTGRTILRLASDHLLHFEDEELRQRYEAALLRLVHLERDKHSLNVSKDESGGSSLEESVAGELLEVALTLSIRPGDPRATSKAFGELLIKMLNACPQLNEYFTPTITRLVFELPAHQLRGLWPVMLHLRAS